MTTNRAVDLVSPKFLESRNAKALQEDMAKLILRNSKQYDFYFFQQLSNGRERVWYRDELKFTYVKHLNARSE